MYHSNFQALMINTFFRRNIQMQMIRSSQLYALVLALNTQVVLNQQDITPVEEGEEEDDG